MEFSASLPPPPPSPAMNPLPQPNLISNFIRLQSDEDEMEAEGIDEADLEHGVLAFDPSAFSGPPFSAKNRAFEEVFGEDSDEEEEEEEEGGLAEREAQRSEKSQAASIRAIQEFRGEQESPDTGEEEAENAWSLMMAVRIQDQMRGW